MRFTMDFVYIDAYHSFNEGLSKHSKIKLMNCFVSVNKEMKNDGFWAVNYGDGDTIQRKQ